jgi:hypothetical protein
MTSSKSSPLLPASAAWLARLKFLFECDDLGELKDSIAHCYQWALPQRSELFLDRVSTGSGSDLVSDQHAIFPNDFRRLRPDQVATAPCTDPIQVQLLLLRQRTISVMVV